MKRLSLFLHKHCYGYLKLGWIMLIIGFALSKGAAQQLWGIQAGNTLSLPRGTDAEFFDDRVLLRNSIGFLARTRIADNLKGRFITPLRKGVIELDYGLNVVWNGFDYRFGNINSSGEQVNFEFPLLLHLYDERNVFMPLRQLRKGVNTFVRAGFKATYASRRSHEQLIIQDNELVRANLRVRPFNLVGSYSVGLMRRMRNGRVMLFEVSANFGLFRATEGDITYELANGQFTESVPYRDNGSYLALNIAYFWKRKKSNRPRNPKRLPPIIYHPRQL
ncbi:MAG: hypothetical protein AAFP77_00930 [Bacteroidota bacterium]